MTAPWDARALRAEEFPELDGCIYLNSASTGPLPERARRALEIVHRRRGAPHLITDPEIFAALDETRALVARLVNADADEIALATSTTYGLNLAAMGLPLAAGDVVVVSDREFPANVYPWLSLRERGIQVELLPVTPSGWPDEARMLERIQDPRVKVLATSLVQFSSGHAADLATLSPACRDTGTWLVVDAIQGVGQRPLDLRATPVDVLACGAQKWLLGPWGTGFAYVSRRVREQVRPPVIDWMAFEGTDDFTRLTSYSDTFRPNARRYELITLPYEAIHGMRQSIELILAHGVAEIAEHVRALQAPLLAWADAAGVRVASPLDHHRSAILCLAPDGARSRYDRLREAGVIASFREGAIRLAPHLFNSMDEIERVVDVLDAPA